MAKNMNKKRGQVILMAVIFFLFIAMAIIFGVVSPILKHLAISQNFVKSQVAYYSAEAGSEDAYYRLKNNINISFPLALTVDNSSVTVTNTTIGSGENNVLSSSNLNGIVRKTNKDITTTGGFSFVYGVQVGNGGFDMQGGAHIDGNVYSNGPITGTSGVTIDGTAVSAGPAGSIAGSSGSWSLYITGSAYSHKISNTTITHDAYYSDPLINVVVNGTKNSNSANQPTMSMPISDTYIGQLETAATSGTTLTCSNGTYNISGNVTIGPAVIPCNAVFDGSDKVTLKGTVWIKGNLTVTSGASMVIDSSVGNKGVAVITDNPSNRLTSSKIVLSGGSAFSGSGGADSYVMLITMNNSAENNGSAIGIDVQGGATGNLLTYAPHGLINLSGGVSLREVTAYETALSGGALVSYQVGLANKLLLTGSSGTWKIKLWQDAQ